MRQRIRHPDTGETVLVGDREDVAEALGQPPEYGLTIARYVRSGWPKSNPAPRPIAIDPETRRDLFVISEYLEWNARRLGPGRQVKAR